MWRICVFPWNSPWKISGVRGAHSIPSRAHLAVSTERVLFQTNYGPQWQLVWLRHSCCVIVQPPTSSASPHTFTSHPPDVIHMTGVSRPSPFFTLFRFCVLYWRCFYLNHEYFQSKCFLFLNSSLLRTPDSLSSCKDFSCSMYWPLVVELY